MLTGFLFGCVSNSASTETSQSASTSDSSGNQSDLTSDTPSVIPPSSSSESPSISDSTSKEIPTISDFSTALDATKNNYSLNMEIYQQDFENPNNTMYIQHNTGFDKEEMIFKNFIYKLKEDDYEKFILGISDEKNFDQQYFYEGNDGLIHQRYCYGNDIWVESDYTSKDIMTTKIVDYIIPEHFEYIERDGFFHMKKEYLGTEECSRLAGYYGSYSYLVQTYDFLAFSIKNGRLDKFKTEIDFASESDSYHTFSLDDGQFNQVGETAFSIPAVTLYPEDLLTEDEKLKSAQQNAMKNYTYQEHIHISDTQGNDIERDYSEQVRNHDFHYYFYLDSENAYCDDYIYDVYQDNFVGSSTKTSYETTLIHYEDELYYNTADMDIYDD